MKAIKVFIDEAEQFKMLNLIEKLNGHEDIAMTGTGGNRVCSSSFRRMRNGVCKGGHRRPIE